MKVRSRRGWKGGYRKRSTIGGVLDQAALAKLFALTPEAAQQRRQGWDTHGRDPLRPAAPRVPRLRLELPTAAAVEEAAKALRQLDREERGPGSPSAEGAADQHPLTAAYATGPDAIIDALAGQLQALDDEGAR